MNILSRRKRGWVIFFIFLAAFLIRAGYIFQILKFPLTEYLVGENTFDQCGFNDRALFIASGSWLGGSEVFGKEPLYSYFLALIYRVLGYSHLAAYLIQALLTSIGAVLLYKISSQVFNRTVGYIASFILTFYSVSIFYDALLLRASLVAFLNILLVYLLVKAHKNKIAILWLASGMVLGLSIAARHNILLPFIIFFILFTVRPLRTAVKCTVVFIIGAFVILSPVIIRNYVISDYKRICISKEVNAFWVGNTYNSSGVDLVWSPEYHDLESRSKGSMGKMARIFFSEIEKNPKGYLRLYIRKIWMFFNGYEAPSNTNYYLYRQEFPTILKWPLFNFQLICALGILGIFTSLFRQERPYLLYIFLTVLSGSVILFHIQSRFRLPAAPIFIIFASYFIYFIFDEVRRKNYFKSAVFLLLAIFFYIALKPDLTYAGFRHKRDKIRSIDRTNLAAAYLDHYKKHKDKKALDIALRQCGLALKEERGSSRAYMIRGYIYFLEGRYNDSIDEYKKGIIYDNRDPFLYNELAGVYFEGESYKEAFVYISRALRLSPGSKIFEKNLDLIPPIYKGEDY